MSYYPAFLDLHGRPGVVLGGGGLAAAKARGLRDAGAEVTVVGENACPELRGMAVRAEVTLVEREYQPGDLRGAALAIDASEDPRINALSYQEASRERVLLNVVDQPARCGFIAPAVVARGPLQVAISTSGESPYVAAALRRELEGLLDAGWGPLISMVGRARRDLRRRGIPPAAQLVAYEAMVDPKLRELDGQIRARELTKAS